jgi:epsin
MDRIESLGNTLSQLTMYDIKSMYNQAKNVVLNVSEMEAKVREATNDDPWGASSTLMQEIAQGTFSFQHFNEIMPAIYSRFMEKEAREWRQIYKALQLLEYLVKHGSERVVDDARSHAGTIRMLRSFHYIDDKGKDQGINVRNRAKELVELLSDVDKIRAERRKAKANKNKYVGTGNDGFGGGGGMSFSSGGSRYGGFGSDSLGGGSGSSSYETSNYNNFSGGSSGFRDESRRTGGFEEYNAGDDEISVPRRSNSLSTSAHNRTGSTTTSTSRVTARAQARREPAPAPPPVPEVDLLGGFDDDSFASPASGSSNTNKALPSVSSPPIATPVSLDDDDFADFQAAPVSAPSSPPPQSQTSNQANIMHTLMSSSPAPAMNPAPVRTHSSMGSMGSMMSPQTTKVSSPLSTGNFAASPLTPASPPPASATPSGAKPSSNFDDLWNLSLGSSASKPSTPGGRSMNELQKEKTNASLWGAKAGASAKPSDPFGSFGGFGGGAAAGSSGNHSGGDDLLL